MEKDGQQRLSSAEYFEMAKELYLGSDSRPNPTNFLSHNDEVRDGVNYKVLGELMSPPNWSEGVRRAQKKPRIYLDIRVNQLGNLEVRWAGGLLKIYYRSDFNLRFGMGTEEWRWSTGRSPGELMYVQGFRRLFEGRPRYSELYDTLLKGYVKLVDELILTLGEAVDLVGYDRIELGGEHGYSIVSSMTGAQLHDAREECSHLRFSKV
ncbi:MAG: hypothetical protein K0R85_302 [Devosia sp.]|jgi:hypothetical protein|nr:hypothetical protein [Devosia sp.]